MASDDPADRPQHRQRSAPGGWMPEGHLLVLVLGASGYVGGRLVPRLLDSGYRVRCLARTPDKLRGLPWADDVELVKGDLLETDGLADAFAGAAFVFHLVHSMGKVDGFEH